LTGGVFEEEAAKAVMKQAMDRRTAHMMAIFFMINSSREVTG
jgi:hypothetical protein